MRPFAVIWRFLLDLIIGDDPKIALVVVSALGLTVAGMLSDVVAGSAVPVVGALLVLLGFTLSLMLDTR